MAANSNLFVPKVESIANVKISPLDSIIRETWRDRK
jgi:hypothetical protein